MLKVLIKNQRRYANVTDHENDFEAKNAAFSSFSRSNFLGNAVLLRHDRLIQNKKFEATVGIIFFLKEI